MTESNSELLARLVERFEKPTEKVGDEAANEQKISRENTEEKLAEIRAAMKKMFRADTREKIGATSHSGDTLLPTRKSEERSADFSAKNHSTLHESSSTIFPSKDASAANDFGKKKKEATFGRVWREAFENKRDKIA